MNLEEIKQVIADFQQAPKGVNNCGTMAFYAIEVLPELIAKIEHLQEELRISKLPDDLWLEEYHKRRKAARESMSKEDYQIWLKESKR